MSGRLPHMLNMVKICRWGSWEMRKIWKKTYLLYMYLFPSTGAHIKPVIRLGRVTWAAWQYIRPKITQGCVFRPMTHDTYAADFCHATASCACVMPCCRVLKLVAQHRSENWIKPSSISLQLAAEKLNADWSSLVCLHIRIRWRQWRHYSVLARGRWRMFWSLLFVNISHRIGIVMFKLC